MRRVNVFVVLVSVLGLVAALGAADLAFKETVKIPFAMKSDDLVVEPGKYVVRVTTDSGLWKMTLARASQSTKEIVGVFGDYGEIPAEEQNFKKDYRLQILRETARDGTKTVVFRFDMRNPGGKYYRVLFRLGVGD